MYERERQSDGGRGGKTVGAREREVRERRWERRRKREEEEKKRSNKCSVPLGTVEFITGRRLETR